MFGTFKKDMQLTRQEFARRLPRALNGYDWSEHGTGFIAQKDGHKIDIQLQELDARKIGAIVLPRCEVTFTFSEMNDSDRDAFLRAFERIYQKGGG